MSVDECGLFVSIDHPFLATSTDGIVTDASADGNGVLEIKCPVGGRTIAELSVTRKNFCLKRDAAGCLSLRRSHPYFTQVQFEMAVTGHKWADFVVFSLLENDECDMYLQRVPFCSDFWEKSLLPALQKFTERLVLELLTRRVRRGVPLLP